jgi:hypothetical protein
MVIGPSVVLSLLVGLLCTALYVLIRGSAGGRLLLVYLAAALGAWAGDSIAARLGADVVLLGDYHLLGAFVVASIGIGLVALLGVLGPAGRGARP